MVRAGGRRRSDPDRRIREGRERNLGDAASRVLRHHVLCEAELIVSDVLEIEHLEGGHGFDPALRWQ